VNKWGAEPLELAQRPQQRNAAEFGSPSSWFRMDVLGGVLFVMVQNLECDKEKRFHSAQSFHLSNLLWLCGLITHHALVGVRNKVQKIPQKLYYHHPTPINGALRSG
jgi:hypothetical protein